MISSSSPTLLLSNPSPSHNLPVDSPAHVHLSLATAPSPSLHLPRSTSSVKSFQRTLNLPSSIREDLRYPAFGTIGRWSIGGMLGVLVVLVGEGAVHLGMGVW